MVFLPPTYCGMPLERNHILRASAKWIVQQLACPQGKILPLWRDCNLFCHGNGDDALVPVFIERRDASGDLEKHIADFLGYKDSYDVHDETATWVYLGHDGDAPIFAIDLSDYDESKTTRLTADLGNNARFLDLRIAGPLLPPAQAAILAYARGITHWHRNNQYCCRCGSRTKPSVSGHSRHCRNDSRADFVRAEDHWEGGATRPCAREIFPHITPAVIMLVAQRAPEDGVAKCLLGRGSNIPKRIYSTLAGYVEPGESLEEAVAREVMEETGIGVCQTTYLASQPWPFPGNMMVGFLAQTRDRNIKVAEDELEDARWFTPAEVRRFGEYEDHGDELALPRKDSIARTLIETWLSQHPD